jgi:type VI secretion system secreted protein VgrG
MANQSRRGAVPDFLFEAGPYTTSDLGVVSLQGREALSELFHFRLELALDDVEADFSGVVGKPGLITIDREEGKRFVSGIVSRFEQSCVPSQLTHYTAELVPKIWLLGHRYNSRIFQDMEVPKIIEKVLTDANIPSAEFEFKLQKSYSKREYCVQYRESELAFILRLLEEEGIFFWFEHSEDKHVFTMGDSTSLFKPIEGDPKLLFREPSGDEPQAEHVYEFHHREEVRIGEVVLRDYDFKKPTLDLTKTKTDQIFTELQYYDFPGEYVAPDVGKTLSEVRLEEFQTNRKSGFGKTQDRRFVPGDKFTMEENPRPDLNREYIITRVTHIGSQAQAFKGAAGAGEQIPAYTCEFYCIPSDRPFRPPRITPRPLIHGSQTAIVTGPSGEEIYPDEHGRIKCQFHWDREGKKDEKSSCWIRVSQTWAGPSWGTVVIPRIGQEVVVNFLEGDPDQPLVTGVVYNGDNRPPFPLPSKKSISGVKSDSTKGSGGYNEFVLDDTKGNELIRVHGQYDMDSTIEHDLREHVLNDRSRDVGNNETISVGNDQTYSIGNNQSGTVGVDKTIKVGANHTETIGADKTMTVAANHTENIGADMKITIGANLTETVGVAYTETVGAAMALTVGAGMTQTVGAAYALTVGGALASQCGSASSETVGSSKSSNVGANSSEKVGGSKDVGVGSNLSEDVGSKKSVKVGSDLSESIGGKHSESVAKAYTLKAKTVTIDAKDKITLKTGAAKIEMKKTGDIKITGKKVTVKATQAVELKGMQVKSEGSVKNEVKGAMVTVQASAINTIKGSLVKIN